MSAYTGLKVPLPNVSDRAPSFPCILWLVKYWREMAMLIVISMLIYVCEAKLMLISLIVSYLTVFLNDCILFFSW